jgi:lipoprotein-anchoring transpeptidase ErfK/SrfK
LLTVAGAIATSPRAEAAYFYWHSFAPGYYSGPGYYYYYRPAPIIRRPRVWRPVKQHPVRQEPLQQQAGVKPKSPLIIEVSIRKQRVIIYDANGFFAEAPVSTGVRSHPTPMGVFSVIQKQKWHRSNIYSGAPMPYMQRITWSGIAMHAGVLPGYPASHGCIRMPTAFAIKMYHWTRIGARVLVTPNAVAPQSFSHPLLPTLKVQPPPAAAAPSPTVSPAVAKADKGTAAATPAPKDVKAAVADPPQVAGAKPDPEEAAKADGSAAQPMDVSVKDSKVIADLDKSQAQAPAVSDADGNPLPPIGTGRISVFISGKDSKLYVRQKFAPLFNVPVTIAPSDQPLGTHVFTAEVDKNDPNVLHWTVVSLPGPSRRPLHERVSKRRRGLRRVSAEAKPLPVADSPAEALDRITIPPGVMARIAAAMTSGASIIVSDQGIRQGETGKGTGFILSLR